MWRAFSIGSGQSFHWSKLNASNVAIVPMQIGARHDNSKWQADSLVKGKTIFPFSIYSNTSLFFFHTGHAVDDDPINDSSIDEQTMDDDPNNDFSIDEQTMDVDNTTVIDQRSSTFVTFDCPETHCIMQFRREDRLHAHLLLDSHKILIPSFRLLDKAIIMYKEGLESDNHKQVPTLRAVTTSTSSSTTTNDKLVEGWALFRSRPRVPFTIIQRSYLEKKYNDGEKSGAKWDAASVAEARHFQC